MLDKNFSFEIVEKICTLSSKAEGQYTVEFNRVSYRKKPAAFDLRHWINVTMGGEVAKKLGKGLTLTEDELDALTQAWNEYKKSKRKA